MNEVIRVLNDHRSIRSYTDEPVSPEQLETIVQSAFAAANSINGQQVTIIGVQDPARKKRLSELVGNQVYVDKAPVFLVFCIDFHRAKLALEKHGEELKITDDIESIVAATTDVGIALGSAIAAAESLGLGTVPIGGIRRDASAVVELLGLPKYVYPVSGLVVGHPADRSAKKPRLPLAATFHQETYNAEPLRELVDQYDETVSAYMVERGDQASLWSQRVAGAYSKVYMPNVSPDLKKQGFKFE